MDIVLPGRTTSNDGTVVTEAFRRRWPTLVIQDANQASPVERSALAGIPEFFVYRDPEAFTSWLEHGATPENADTLIHVIIEDHQLTFVVAGYDSETHRLAMVAISELSDARSAQGPAELLGSEEPPAGVEEEADNLGGRWGPLVEIAGDAHA